MTIRPALRNALLTGVVCLMTANAVFSQTTEYNDPKYGIAASLPVGWTWTGPRHYGDQKSWVTFQGPGSKQELRLYVLVLRTPVEISAEKMDKRILKGIAHKIEQRRATGWKDYRLR